MLIDWFTVVAQVINFLILVWLLKRFLYRPILDAIDARERRIADALAEAEAKEAAAQEAREGLQRKHEAFEEQRASLLDQAMDDAKCERERLLEAARQAADAVRAQRMKALDDDARGLHQAIRRRTRDEVFAIARKALTDLAGTGLEERITEVFIGRLRELKDAPEGFGDALKTAARPLRVRSAFDLPAEQRAALQQALDETFGAEIRVEYETAPDLVGGIELTTDGRKISWSIADYLESLEKGVDALLKAQAGAGAGTGPAAVAPNREPTASQHGA